MNIRRLTLFTLAFGFLGCTEVPSRPKPQDIHEDRLSFAEKAGYAIDRQTPGTLVSDHWLNDARQLDITFWAPEAPGKYPLIVYLPGLGQDSDAAPLWREAWVKAGFAVLSVQRAADAKALSNLSAEDRNDLKSIGHIHFNAASLEGRVSDVNAALGHLETQVVSGKPPYSQARIDDLTLAGFDLGAQTIQVILGEQVKGIRLPATLPRPKAAILLSPHVDLSKGGMQRRFEKLSTPLLVVSGTDDHDPWGMTAPSVRSAPWQQAQAGEKMLLNLTNGTHRQLAGIDPLSTKPEDQEIDPDEMLSREAEDMDRSSRNHRPQPQGRASQFGDARRGFGPGYDPHHYGRQLAIIETVSTAFLNAEIRRDRKAREWIQGGAKQWIGAAGELRIR